MTHSPLRADEPLPRFTRYGGYTLAGAALAIVVAASLAVPAVSGSLTRGEALTQMTDAAQVRTAAAAASVEALGSVRAARERAADAVAGQTSPAADALRALARLDATGQLEGEIFPTPAASAAGGVLPTTPQGMRARAAEDVEAAQDADARTRLYRARAEEIARAVDAL